MLIKGIEKSFLILFFRFQKHKNNFILYKNVYDSIFDGTSPGDDWLAKSREVMEGVERNFVIHDLDFGVGRRGVLDESVEYFDHTY